MYRMIDKIIYFYIFICAALLVFNLIYIFRSKALERQKRRREERWRRALTAFAQSGAAVREPVGDRPSLSDMDAPLRPHSAAAWRRLSRVGELTAWYDVLFGGQPILTGEKLEEYLKAVRLPLLELAWKYKKRNAMERAFFACIIQSWAAGSRDGREVFLAPMLAYLEDSSVYCRENVLRALYTLGSPEAVARAFDYISSRQWYHHPKLISDGLLEFCGTDREAMAAYLWKHCQSWAENFAVAVVQFAANLPDRPSGGLGETFYCALVDVKTPQELRFALLRYFRRHKDARVRQFLLELMADPQGETAGLKIVAASVLAEYPGQDTKDALIGALGSPNWYVRQNAALSLRQLGMTAQDRARIYESNDQYAIDMIRYITKETPQGGE